MALVVQVAESSLERDRSWKSRIYASAGIPEYWILNLPERGLERYRAPEREAGVYQSSQQLPAGECVELQLPGGSARRIPIADLLP